MVHKLITLVRHGQAAHNLPSQHLHLRDPYLTDLGEEQCLALRSAFPSNPPPTLIVTSPLKRTIQTALLSFQPYLISHRVPLILLPELQETSDLPCDTGSSPDILAADPMLKAPGISIDYSVLPKDWTSKSGKWAANPDALQERSQSAKLWLRERMEEHIVCVLHGGFLHYLADDWREHGDFLGTRWNNTEFRTYVFDGQSMVETEESRQRRAGEKPPGEAEKMRYSKNHLKN